MVMEDLYVAGVSAEGFQGKKNKIAALWCSFLGEKGTVT